MQKIDFHIHSNYILNWESHISPKQIINIAKKLNYSCISITEHASMKFRNKIHYFKTSPTYNNFKNYAKKKGILLIPGAECFVENGEILLINFNKDIKNLNSFDKLEKLKDENVLIIAPHPFYVKPQCLKNSLIKNIKLFDAIEHSRFYTSLINPNKKAIRVANRYQKPLIANSDAHFLHQFNINYSIIDSDLNKDSIFEAIRKNKIQIHTKPYSTFNFIKGAYKNTVVGFYDKLMNLP